MNSVELYKNDTCVTYALKRIGAFELYPLDYPQLTDGILFEVLTFNATKLSVGDLLLFESRTEKEFYPLTIDNNLRIVDKPIWTGFHVAVYEGDGLVSECNRDRCCAYPSISLFKLDDRVPQKILKRKTLNQV